VNNGAPSADCLPGSLGDDSSHRRVNGPALCIEDSLARTPSPEPISDQRQPNECCAIDRLRGMTVSTEAGRIGNWGKCVCVSAVWCAAHPQTGPRTGVRLHIFTCLRVVSQVPSTKTLCEGRANHIASKSPVAVARLRGRTPGRSSHGRPRSSNVGQAAAAT
jgi:hypothetical protein